MAWKDPFPLGRPNDNTEESAELYFRYATAATPLSLDHIASFFQMCGDMKAVQHRAEELLKQRGYRWSANRARWVKR